MWLSNWHSQIKSFGILNLLELKVHFRITSIINSLEIGSSFFGPKKETRQFRTDKFTLKFLYENVHSDYIRLHRFRVFLIIIFDQFFSGAPRVLTKKYPKFNFLEHAGTHLILFYQIHYDHRYSRKKIRSRFG